jgi:hypothetical protein
MEFPAETAAQFVAAGCGLVALGVGIFTHDAIRVNGPGSEERASLLPALSFQPSTSGGVIPAVGRF